MNLKDKYRAKLIEQMLQKEKYQYQTIDECMQPKLKEQEQTKINQIRQKLSDKITGLPKQIQKKTNFNKNDNKQQQFIQDTDKQNQGDNHNSNLKKNLNLHKVGRQNDQKYIRKPFLKNQSDSLLELSQIQHQNRQNQQFKNLNKKIDGINNCQPIQRQKNKKKMRFIDKIKNMGEDDTYPLTHKNRYIQKSLQESTVTRQIRRDKTVVALFDDCSFNFTIDIQVSSGVKVPLQVNEKSDIRLVSQQFVKDNNLTSFGNLAQLLQKEICHQIQKQKKENICTKYKKESQVYERIATNFHVQQVLIKNRNEQNQSNSIQSGQEDVQNFNSNSIQQVEQVYYINLCTKEPFLIPNKLYQKAKLKKYSYRQNQKQPFQRFQDQDYNDLGIDQNYTHYLIEKQNAIRSEEQSNQLINQRGKNYQNNYMNVKYRQYQQEERQSPIAKSGHFNEFNCFDQIQDIEINQKQFKKPHEKRSHIQFKSHEKYTERDNLAQKYNLTDLPISIDKGTQKQQKNIKIPRQNSSDRVKISDKSKLQLRNLEPYISQNTLIKTQNLIQKRQQDESSDCYSSLDQQQRNSRPRINCISEQIVNRLGKQNILLEKIKKSNHIKESILIERQQKIKRQLQQCSFKPKINSISKFIDKKVKLSHLLRNSNHNQNNSTEYQSKQLKYNNNEIYLQKNSQMTCKDRFDQLYQNSKVLSNKKQQTRRKSIQEMSFRPQINTISKKIVQSKRNSIDLIESSAIKKNRRQSVQFQPKNLFQGKDLSYALDRNLQGLPIGEYLYKEAMKLKKKRQSLQIGRTENFKTLQTSQKLIQRAKQRKIEQIFNELTNFSKDGLLYPDSFNLNSPKFGKNSKDSVRYFVPLLEEMKQLQVQLNKDQFLKSGLKLFLTLSQNQKAEILNSKKLQTSQKSIQKNQRKMSNKKISAGCVKNQNQSIYIRGLMHRKNVKSKIELQLENKVRKELRECTFKPQIRSYMTIQ